MQQRMGLEEGQGVKGITFLQEFPVVRSGTKKQTPERTFAEAGLGTPVKDPGAGEHSPQITLLA